MMAAGKVELGKFVNVPGLGNIPEHFLLKTDTFDIDDDSSKPLDSYEGRITATAGGSDSVANDEFGVEGQKTATGYQLIFHVNSESHQPIWFRSKTILTYTTATKSWKAKTEDGTKAIGINNVKAVIATLSAGLKHAAKAIEEEATRTALTSIMEKAVIAQTSGLLAFYNPPPEPTVTDDDRHEPSTW